VSTLVCWYCTISENRKQNADKLTCRRIGCQVCPSSERGASAAAARWVQREQGLSAGRKAPASRQSCARASSTDAHTFHSDRLRMFAAHAATLLVLYASTGRARCRGARQKRTATSVLPFGSARSHSGLPRPPEADILASGTSDPLSALHLSLSCSCAISRERFVELLRACERMTAVGAEACTRAWRTCPRPCTRAWRTCPRPTPRPSRRRRPPPALRVAHHPCQLHNKLVLLASTWCARGVTGAARCGRHAPCVTGAPQTCPEALVHAPPPSLFSPVTPHSFRPSAKRARSAQLSASKVHVLLHVSCCAYEMCMAGGAAAGRPERERRRAGDCTAHLACWHAREVTRPDHSQYTTPGNPVL
jgi:hypothetical protein